MNNSGHNNGRHELREVLISHKPSFIARWAFVLFAAVLTIIITVAWFIRYPEVIKLKAVILPAAETKGFYAEVILPRKHAVKIEPGQLVQIRLDDYAYDEFGFVPGNLQYISNNGPGNPLTGHIQLPQGLNTVRRKKIEYKPAMKAEALIFSKDIRLLERLFRKLWPSMP